VRAALCGLLLLALAFASVAQSSGPLAPAGPVLDLVGMGDTARGIGDSSGGVPNGLVDSNCGGTAPITTSCDAVLQVAPGSSLQLYASGGTGFTGTIVATLLDQAGNAATFACTYTLFVGGVSPQPSCQGGGAGTLQAGSLRLMGSVSNSLPAAPAPLPVAPPAGPPSAGYWEVGLVPN
jgi:hypothetical protein